MRKEIVETGKNGIFRGYVEVQINYRSEDRVVTHAATHDDRVAKDQFHRVTAYANGRPVMKALECTLESDLLLNIEKAEEKLQEVLKGMANKNNEKNIYEKLKDKGYGHP